MELKNVFTFLRVAELGSFTKTANELGYSQSTITVQIRQLETELGFPLFDRIGKKVSLTPMGEEFVTYASAIMRITEKARAMGRTSGTYYGTLRLGILESLFMWRFSDLIPCFHRELPFIGIEIKTASGSELYQMLRQNELDIVYILGKKLTQRDCIRACTNPERMVFVTASDNPLIHTNQLLLGEVLRQPLILAERMAIYRRELDEAAAAQNIEVTPFLEVDNVVALRKLLKQKMGVSFLPEYSVAESVRKGELSILEVKDCDIRLWSQVMYHRNKWVTPQMELFIKLIRGTISAEQEESS